MRQILAVSRKTEGRPNVLDVPEGGWTYQHLAEMPAAGTYHVELGKHLEAAAESVDELPEDEIAAGHTFAILGRASKAWDTHVSSLLRTIKEQQELIVKLYGMLSAKHDPEPSPDVLGSLKALAPIVKALLGDGDKNGDAKKPDGAAGDKS